jgi:hypothetical protein
MIIAIITVIIGFITTDKSHFNTYHWNCHGASNILGNIT